MCCQVSPWLSPSVTLAGLMIEAAACAPPTQLTVIASAMAVEERVRDIILIS